MVTITIHCTLLAKEEDIMGYKNLVFKNLDNAPFGYNYVLTTVFPNWESRIPEIGENGYLLYDEVQSGIDTYYDSITDSIIKYNFTRKIYNNNYYIYIYNLVYLHQ